MHAMDKTPGSGKARKPAAALRLGSHTQPIFLLESTMNIKHAIFAAALSALGLASTAQAQESDLPQSNSASTLSRAEVQANTQAWRDAGLAEEGRGEQTPNIYSPEYRQKLVTYNHWVAQHQASTHG
jgi:hypothetical protein